MKEQITGHVIACDKCGEYLSGSDWEQVVFVSETDAEIKEYAESCEWDVSDDGSTHVCSQCKGL